MNWLTIQRYAEVYEVTGEQRDDLFYHVQRLDQVYLEWSQAKFKKKAKENNAGKKLRRGQR